MNEKLRCGWVWRPRTLAGRRRRYFARYRFDHRRSRLRRRLGAWAWVCVATAALSTAGGIAAHQLAGGGASDVWGEAQYSLPPDAGFSAAPGDHPVVTPEPGSFTVLLPAFALVAILRRRRRSL